MNSLIVFKENILLCGVLFTLIFTSALLLVGCAESGTEDFSQDITSGTMLIDYYYADKSAAGGDGYTEMVLYATDNKDQLRLSVYSKENESEYESCTEYLVPYEVAENCYKAIKKHRLDCWNGMKNSVSLDGTLVVCKYYSNGEYIRVSTEEMPENGETVLKNISDIMSEFINTDYMIETQNTEDELR